MSAGVRSKVLSGIGHGLWWGLAIMASRPYVGSASFFPRERARESRSNRINSPPDCVLYVYDKVNEMKVNHLYRRLRPSADHQLTYLQ